MSILRPVVLSIAGFDPSGGAGLLADIKTFEANKVQGLGVVSALTFQNESTFEKVEWIEAEKIALQIEVLHQKNEFKYVKIGIIQNIDSLIFIINYLNKLINKRPIYIIWDPIIRASAGFEFHKAFQTEKLLEVLNGIFLITPNTEEAKFLTGMDDEKQAAEFLAKNCNVLLKGGHNVKEKGKDFL